MKNPRLIAVLGVLAAIVILSLSAVILSLTTTGYFLVSRQNTVKTEAAAPAANPPANTQAAQPQAADGIPFFPGNSAVETAAPTETTMESIAKITTRLFIAVLLSAILAFRPRKDVPFLQRNLYVSQTQILLAVVAAALMMIVGDNTARAFAIFAAVSLVRFRTNIRDPKEITVLLISLALGLAAGVGRWDLGLVLCLFSLALLWLLEYREPEMVSRSMALTIKTRNTDATHIALKPIFERHRLETEVRQIEPPDDNSAVGCIVYYLNLRLNVSTDKLSEAILSSDPDNIEGIQWEQKKDASYIYQ